MKMQTNLTNSIRTATTAASTTSSTSSTTKSSTSSLGKDDFLKILVAQLQNQDPLNPMDNTQFISQMAQFSSLEQMQSLNQTLTLSQAYNMVGKTISVTGNVANDGSQTTITGQVDSIVNSGGIAYLVVGDMKIPYGSDMTVLASQDKPHYTQEILQASGIIGKQVSISDSNSNTGTNEIITGIVKKILVKEGQIIINVNDKEYKLSDVREIQDPI